MGQLLFVVLMLAGFGVYYVLVYKKQMSAAQKNLGTGDMKALYGASWIKGTQRGGHQDVAPVLLGVTNTGVLRFIENNGVGPVRELALAGRVRLGGNVRQESQALFSGKDEAYQMLNSAGKLENARVMYVDDGSGQPLTVWTAESNAAALLQLASASA